MSSAEAFAMDPGTAPARSPADGLRERMREAALSAIRLAAAAAELWLAAAWLAGDLPAGRLLAAHGTLALALAPLALATRRWPRSDLWTFTLLVLLAGPLGAIAPFFARERSRGGDLRARFAAESVEIGELSRAEALEADLAADRRPRRDPSNLASLMDRVRDGGLEEQQFAVSMLSLRYDPALQPVLLAALQSPAPAVRVQAAAVFAKLRERFSAEAKALLAAGDDERAPGSAAAFAAASACRALTRNPLVDEAARSALAARAEALDLVGSTEAPGAAPPGPRSRPSTETTTSEPETRAATAPARGRVA